ncbi:hypothetical protein ASD65_02875 [Microbacterium sp. Root61]|uniref:PH-like domain-containing protein n=1 Tax=Microbacterium sp. Root61 TaxID=1736570 RepID=UPI0006FB8784|nr:hypothetical protein [Microbacterium sp. Root61]KRA23477.1 hypothetical protein ASD65_02875 [Microbacterium sp. Root61]
MTREGALVVMILVAVLLLVLLAWAWRRRTKRDAGLTAPIGEAPAGATVLCAFPGLYVATTRHDEPLERLAIKGLGFRSRGVVTVTDAGVVLDLAGTPRLFLPVHVLVAAGQSTVAIDRVVEPDGLTRLTWHIDADTIVDTYFRPQDASARALADAILPLIPTSSPASSPAQTGSDA